MEGNNKIEDIKRRLYDRDDTVTHRTAEGVLHPIARSVATSWEQDSTIVHGSPTLPSISTMKKRPPTSIFKKFFIFTVVFFIAALGYAGYMYMNGGVSVSNDNIDVLILGNAFTKGGDELPLQIEIVNHNKANLELANLSVSYPRGADDSATSLIRLPREAIGTIAPGQSVTRTIKVTLFGDEKSVRPVHIALEYHPEGSNAIFTKEKDYSVTISSAPLTLSIDAPTTATNDQPVTLTVKASLNTTLPDGHTILQVTYPNNFIYDSAEPAPYVGNSVWDLSSLSLTNPVTISIRGKFMGQDGDEQVFHAYSGASDPNDASRISVVYNSLLHPMTLTKPFLETHILVNNQDLSTYTTSSGEEVHAQVTWVNNLSNRITDAQIIANLSGNAFDRTSVNPVDGFYDSKNNRIIWDKNTVEDLGSVEPGGRGSVNFSFKPLSLVGKSSSMSNPQIALDVSIKGSQPNEGSLFSDVNNFSKKIIKVVSDFQIAASARYNSGALPPQVETQTLYTVTWTLSNSTNSVNQAQATTTLPIYINWIGPVAGGGERISYNEVTRQVIWNIGTVRPNTGFDSNREASFIVSLTPSLSQAGSVPQLTKDVYISGIDSFSGAQVKSSKSPITTLLSNDPSFKNGDERVIN
jgi:hypothetical protein